MLLKAQQRFKNEKHNLFTDKLIKIPLTANDNKRMQSIASIEAYMYGTSKDLLCEEKKSNNIIKQYKND